MGISCRGTVGIVGALEGVGELLVCLAVDDEAGGSVVVDGLTVDPDSCVLLDEVLPNIPPDVFHSPGGFVDDDDVADIM